MRKLIGTAICAAAVLLATALCVAVARNGFTREATSVAAKESTAQGTEQGTATTPPVKPKDTRVNLLIATIETPDTRTDALQKVLSLPELRLPYNDADLSAKTGDDLRRAQRANEAALLNYNSANVRIFYDEYRRRVALQAEIARKDANTKVGRNLIQARDWLAASMMEHGDTLNVIFRVDDQEAQTEKFFASLDALDVATSTYFVKLVVNDPKQKEETIRTPGGNTLTRTTTSQLVTAHIQNFKNEMVFSKRVEESVVSGSSSVVTKAGSGDEQGEALRKCLDTVAKEVAAHFTAKKQ